MPDELFDAGLDPVEFRIALELVRRWRGGDQVDISVADLGNATGLNRKTIRRKLPGVAKLLHEPGKKASVNVEPLKRIAETGDRLSRDSVSRDRKSRDNAPQGSKVPQPGTLSPLTRDSKSHPPTTPYREVTKNEGTKGPIRVTKEMKERVNAKWAEVTGRSSDTPLTKGRDNLLKIWLKQYSVEDTFLILDGFALSNWHMGRDPATEGEKYDQLDNALRHKNADKFIEKARMQHGSVAYKSEINAAATELIDLCLSGDLRSKIGSASGEAQKMCGRIGLSRLEAMDAAEVRGCVYSAADKMAGKT